MSYSVNDKYYEARWNDIDTLDIQEKYRIALNNNLITEDEEDLSSRELTEIIYNSDYQPELA